jgi:hypothetical protein
LNQEPPDIFHALKRLLFKLLTILPNCLHCSLAQVELPRDSELGNTESYPGFVQASYLIDDLPLDLGRLFDRRPNLRWK